MSRSFWRVLAIAGLVSALATQSATGQVREYKGPPGAAQLKPAGLQNLSCSAWFVMGAQSITKPTVVKASEAKSVALRYSIKNAGKTAVSGVGVDAAIVVAGFTITPPDTPRATRPC